MPARLNLPGPAAAYIAPTLIMALSASFTKLLGSFHPSRLSAELSFACFPSPVPPVSELLPPPPSTVALPPSQNAAPAAPARCNSSLANALLLLLTPALHACLCLLLAQKKLLRREVGYALLPVDELLLQDCLDRLFGRGVSASCSKYQGCPAFGVAGSDISAKLLERLHRLRTPVAAAIMIAV